ncbi:hypothetical protein Dimus_014221 [Dionaea muscipula]
MSHSDNRISCGPMFFLDHKLYSWGIATSTILIDLLPCVLPNSKIAFAIGFEGTVLLPTDIYFIAVVAVDYSWNLSASNFDDHYARWVVFFFFFVVVPFEVSIGEGMEGSKLDWLK